MDHLDHRSIGQRLDLFHQQDESPGAVFWHPRGWMLYRIIEDYVRRRMRSAGFREIRTPQLMSRRLWEQSGHWDKYRNNMFALAQDGDGGERVMALKPMSCPGHVELYRSRLWSYRELPARFAEFGAVHRNEASGALSGLMRLRAFTQDDAHVFCRPDQVVDEVAKFATLLSWVYADFGFDKIAAAFRHFLHRCRILSAAPGDAASRRAGQPRAIHRRIVGTSWRTFAAVAGARANCCRQHHQRYGR